MKHFAGPASSEPQSNPNSRYNSNHSKAHIPAWAAPHQ